MFGSAAEICLSLGSARTERMCGINHCDKNLAVANWKTEMGFVVVVLLWGAWRAVYFVG